MKRIFAIVLVAWGSVLYLYGQAVGQFSLEVSPGVGKVCGIAPGGEESLIGIGKFFVAGRALENSFLFKVGTNGTAYWSKEFSPNTACWLNNVVMLADSSIVIQGSVRPYGTPLRIRIDQDGNILHSRTSRSSSFPNMYAQKIDTTRNGGYSILWALTGMNGFGISTYDSSGNVQLARRFYETGVFLFPSSFIPTSDGGFLIAGSKSVTPTNTDAFVTKVSSSGSLQWTHQFGDQYLDDVRDIAEVPGGYLLGGISGTAPSSEKAVLSKISTSGTLLWRHRYSGPARRFYGVIPVFPNRIFLRGYGGALSTSKVFGIMVDSLGNVLTDQLYLPTGSARSTDFCDTQLGSRLVIGGQQVVNGAPSLGFGYIVVLDSILNTSCPPVPGNFSANPTMPLFASNPTFIQSSLPLIHNNFNITLVDQPMSSTVHCQTILSENWLGVQGAWKPDVGVDFTWEFLGEFESFQIERKRDDGSFEKVSPQLRDQYWQDVNPVPGISLYRIGAVSQNAVVEYSDVVIINVLEENTLSLKIWPNPAQDKLHLKASNPEDLRSCTLFDLMGRPVHSWERQVQNGLIWSISTAIIPTGRYFLVIRLGKTRTARMIEIQR